MKIHKFLIVRIFLSEGNMRQKILDKILNSIKSRFKYSDEKLLEIRYGLETLYITISKTIVIMVINLLFRTFKELLFLMLFYGLVRLTGFGMHAKKSWHCWAMSLTIFAILPLLIKFISFRILIRFIIYFICTIYILNYAPADTEKRPLINKNKRNIYNVICTITAFCISIYGLLSRNSIIQNSIMFSLVLESLMISPMTYKLFKLRYNNYKYH